MKMVEVTRMLLLDTLYENEYTSVPEFDKEKKLALMSARVSKILKNPTLSWPSCQHMTVFWRRVSKKLETFTRRDNQCPHLSNFDQDIMGFDEPHDSEFIIKFYSSVYSDFALRFTTEVIKCEI